ncbi:MAG: hypothetical protein NC181_05550 [Clostridium sp.]|nr:hypothetical protein [Clostridium sp.]MCM1444726.1 hypothetical protein [Candidatus Amulumruptor caecigallinarius]
MARSKYINTHTYRNKINELCLELTASKEDAVQLEVEDEIILEKRLK